MLKEKKRILKFSESIYESLFQSMKKDKRIILLGLGVDDPKGIFGTTFNLHKIFKSNRVFHSPASENAMTGLSIGAAINGYKPIITHQRVEFSLVAMDQVINQAAKWFFMTDGKVSVPLVIRILIGRGWGQGPQHSQSLESIFSHIPGLKVVTPSNSYDAKGLLNSSIKDKNPVIFFEHRWLHDTLGAVPKKYYKIEIGKAKIINKGKDVTIVANSFNVIECLKIITKIKDKIKIELIDLRSLRPLDINTIIKSVKKTKKILVLDSGWLTYGVSAEIISAVNDYFSKKNIKIKTKRLGLADKSMPSSPWLAKNLYLNEKKIFDGMCDLLNLKNKAKIYSFKNKKEELLDTPDKNFKGPF